MRWFVFKKVTDGAVRYLFVQAKTLASANKRLTRWSKRSIVDVSSVLTVNSGVGYETMSEPWHKFGEFTMIDGSY